MRETCQYSRPLHVERVDAEGPRPDLAEGSGGREQPGAQPPSGADARARWGLVRHRPTMWDEDRGVSVGLALRLKALRELRPYRREVSLSATHHPTPRRLRTYRVRASYERLKDAHDDRGIPRSRARRWRSRRPAPSSAIRPSATPTRWERRHGPPGASGGQCLTLRKELLADSNKIYRTCSRAPGRRQRGAERGYNNATNGATC